MTVPNVAPVPQCNKKLLGQARTPQGRAALQLSVSFYPHHREILARREKELNMSRSILLQLLLEIEARDGIARRELLYRLRRSEKPTTTPQKETNDPTTIHAMAQ
jgi:hypothetical protein